MDDEPDNDDNEKEEPMSFAIPLPEGVAEMLRERQEKESMYHDSITKAIRSLIDSLGKTELEALSEVFCSIAGSSSPRALAAFWQGSLSALHYEKYGKAEEAEKLKNELAELERTHGEGPTEED
jgi:hypothetical protein